VELTAMHMTNTAPRPAIRIAGMLLAAAGLILLAWLAWTLTLPAQPLYGYSLQKQGGAEAFPELGLAEGKDLQIAKYRVEVGGAEKPAAYAYVADSQALGPVLLQWESQVTEPLLYADSRIAEVAALAEKLEGLDTPEAGVMAWWDVSRQLALLCDCNLRLHDHLGEQLLIPASWRTQEGTIAGIEAGFWPASTGDEQARLDLLASAMLSDEQQGADKLRDLLPGKDGLLVVHVADAFKLGAHSPEQFGVGFKDFPDTGDMHGMIQRVKDWLKEQGYTNYIVERRAEAAVRVYFLTDPEPSPSLITRLLPFKGMGPTGLTRFKLVQQHGGYWVYRLVDG
jgi:hydroxylamine oxidation protein HaoB